MRNIIFSLCYIWLLTGCFFPGQSFYQNDPLTGGVNRAGSVLLNIPLPAGLQYYPSHSKISGGARKEGLEVWRGYVDINTVSTQLYESLKQAGWQIRYMQKAGARALFIYECQNEMAAIVFFKQGSLTIMQIWSGARLTDGTSLAPSNLAPSNDEGEELNSIPAEEFPAEPRSNTRPAPRQEVETWGGEEREI